MATNVKRLDEMAERRLVEYLVHRVRGGLSGVDGEDLIDAAPSRSIFAGVLQGLRHKDEDAAVRGIVSGEAPMGTAMGLDFRVRPNGDGRSLALSLKVRWAHYYPLFPTYNEAMEANRADRGGEHTSEAVLPNELTTVEETLTVDEDTPTALAADATQTIEAPPAGRVALPRVWRRLPVAINLPSINLPLGGRAATVVGEPDIQAALRTARTKIEGDVRGWHHLGELRTRERSLGDRAALASEDAYERALQGKRGNRVVPPDWGARIQIDTEPDALLGGVWRVRVLLSNATPERSVEDVDPGLEERPLFDACIELEISGGELEPFDFVLAPKDYRSKPEMAAKGINCCAYWEASSPLLLRTETLPVFAQPLYRTRESLAVSFDDLASTSALSELSRMTEAMADYIADWQTFLDSHESERFSPTERAACSVDKAAFEDEMEAYRLGIEALRRDALLLRAFNLMNRTFSTLGERSGGRLRAWRLFQIAFICSQLPSLAVRELNASEEEGYADRLRASLSEVGVLWFPTGGGKTEAYLGLIAVALLYDRLRGKSRGVTAWMRFPLRMLSLQQLDRLAKVIAVLNELRATETSVSLGDPFAIGYYVGDNNTPNAVSDDDMRRYETNPALRHEIKLVRQCPHCRSAVQIRADRTAWRLSHICENRTCFSNTSASLGEAKGSLPIYVVDTEIYRYVPSVLVGTVDKLAIIGRSRYFCHLLRGVRQSCPEHGYTSYDECIEHWNGCKRKGSQLKRLEPIRDPGPSLLIQDELHLLRDELGVFNGHYEGLLKFLCSAAYFPPKLLCATATIEAYDVQTFHIYLARARRFPQPGWLAGESFYATSTPLEHRRIYIGLFNHTRAIEDSALRVIALYQRELRRLKAVPERACAIMSLAPSIAGPASDSLRLHDLSVCYVNRKAVGGSIIEKLTRADQLLAYEGLGELKGVLLTGDQTIDEVGAILDRIEHQVMETHEPRLDVLAATSLISHGVDLEPINMMTICGMPSHYAEYVQATSRSARSHPGAVFVCFNSRDPRERSQFEFFYPMHEHIERLIEAVAVNRFASYAPKKTVPGLLLGLLLNLYTPDLFGSSITKPLDHVPTLQAALGLRPSRSAPCLDREALCASIEVIVGVDVVRSPASPAQVKNAQHQVRLTFSDIMGTISRTLESKLQDVIHPITSFRDVDEGIEFGSIDSASLMTRMRSR